MIGIKSYGVYVPKLRMSRQGIYQAMGWFAPTLIGAAKGERSMCNWDEDSITMAVSAASSALFKKDKQGVDSLLFASTTLPFADRQNAGIIRTALNLKEECMTQDVTGSQRAGVSAVISAINAAKSKNKDVLVVASDSRRAKPGSVYEMYFGDGAASLLIGQGDDIIAEFVDSYSMSIDFNEHLRGSGRDFDYFWEERWARDEGYLKFIPKAIMKLLEKTGISAKDVTKFIYPCVFARDHGKIGKIIGAEKEQIQDNLHSVMGESGCAHPLVMLTKVLEEAKPGDILVVCGFGHGVDAVCVKVTENITNYTPKYTFKECLENKKTIDNYARFLVYNKNLQPDLGLRGEEDLKTSLSVLYRNNKMIFGLVGGKCKKCGTVQFPKQDICVNPECKATHSQEEYEFSDKKAKIMSYTGDMLAASLDPPHKYGLIQFEGGGRMLADFTDCVLEELKVGLEMEMVFRIRHCDDRRGFKQYFWKARPIVGAKKNE